MKNIIGIFLLTCMTFLLSSCNSLYTLFLKPFYPYRQIKPGYEERIISTEKVFKPKRNPTPLFRYIEDNSLIGIELSYSQSMEEYEVSTVQTYKFFYEGQDIHTGRFENVRESERQKEGAPKKREILTENKKTETVLPPIGTEVVIIIGNSRNSPRVSSLSSEGGILLFTEELQAKILMAGTSIDNFSNCSIGIPSLSLQSMVDLSKTKFFEKAHSDTQALIASLPQSVINSPSTCEAFAKALVALKPKMKYPFQNRLLVEILSDKLNIFLKQLELEKVPLVDVFPEFFIQGEITDTSENSNALTYSIWGIAQPLPMNLTTVQSNGYRDVRSNLTVVLRKNITTETISRTGTTIIMHGGFYYVTREYGTNVSGQRVPVFLYCNDISQVPGAGERGTRLNSLNTQIASVKEIYSRYEEQLK
ncbi:hypothetical protein LQZ19_15575 [Treponema primitia]|uniref:hypothetical protein n=1 Tax=Treponema primitia TaxID=88058 RepID=UPI00397FE00F